MIRVFSKTGALASVAALAAISVPLGASAQSGQATTIARVDLKALNNSGASGQATLRLSADGRMLSVLIQASGLERGGTHLSHIHGLSANGSPVDSSCPTDSEDSDNDGFVELDEGGVKYGPILIDFMNVDPDGDGRVTFKTDIALSGSEMALPLHLRHIVVHGKTVGAVGAGTPGEVDGTAGYKTVLPVLCGEIAQSGKAPDPMEFRGAPQHTHRN